MMVTASNAFRYWRASGVTVIYFANCIRELLGLEPIREHKSKKRKQKEQQQTK